MKTKITIFLILLLSGCATRKKSLQVDTFKKDVKEVVINDIHVTLLEEEKITRKTIAPIDPNKPMTVDGKEYKNAIIQESVEERKKDSTAVDKSKTDKSETVKEKSRNLDVQTKRFPVWGWLIIGFVACFVAWRVIKKTTLL